MALVSERVQAFPARGSPEDVRSRERRAADHVHEHGIESALANSSLVLRHADRLELHVDADIVELFDLVPPYTPVDVNEG